MSFTIKGSPFVQDKTRVNSGFDSYPSHTKRSTLQERTTRTIPSNVTDKLSFDTEKLTLRVKVMNSELNSAINETIASYISRDYLGKVNNGKLIHSYEIDPESQHLSLGYVNIRETTFMVKVIAQTFMVKRDDIIEMILNVKDMEALHVFVVCSLTFDKKITEFVDRKIIIGGKTYEDNKKVLVKITDVYLVDGLMIKTKGIIIGEP